jgi:raffinose/stachyose/melibiose transport system substrate-binding protein/xylobiose transport system substrate-binding protein
MAILVVPAVIGATAACGTGKEQASSHPDGELQIWSTRDVQSQPALESVIDEYNKTSKTKLVLTTYASDTYKQKIRSAMSSPDGPDIFLNWGGGNLAQLVQEKKVLELGTALSRHSEAFGSLMPIVLSVAQVNGVEYGVPMNGMQPNLLFYNRDVFSAAGVQPPGTFDDLLRLVDTFKAQGIVPFALAGSQGWSELMYLEYIVERLGGPVKSANIATSATGAWTDPTVLRAARMTQDLVKRGAFGDSFSAVGYDNNGASRLLATGKAAMHLMGTWEYGSQLTANPEFARSGSMGWVPFPAVTGGAGDVRELVGNPSNFFSVSATSKHSEAATDFLMKTMTSQQYLSALIKGGLVPAVKGVDTQVQTARNVNADFALYTYKMVENAPSFTQSWEQGLAPAVATELNTNIQRLFQLQISPEEFVAAMSQAKP